MPMKKSLCSASFSSTATATATATASSTTILGPYHRAASVLRVLLFRLVYSKSQTSELKHLNSSLFYFRKLKKVTN